MIKEGHSVCSDLFETSIFLLWSHDICLHTQTGFNTVLRSGYTSLLWNIILLCKYFSMLLHEPFYTHSHFQLKKPKQTNLKNFLPQYFVFKKPDEIFHNGNLQSCIWRLRVNTTFPFTVTVVPVFKEFFANFCADLRTR